MIEVWIGTPNEMEKAHSAKTQGAATKWARGQLDGLAKQATKYDGGALDHIHSVKEQMLQTGPIQLGDKRTWSFPYIAVTYRIEIRNA